MIKLPAKKLAMLRDQLQTRGQRPSMVIPRSSLDVAEAMAVVQEYGDICDVMYLMMAADRRVKNVEREVLRGALDILSGDRVRTAHMEAMLEASTKRLSRYGEAKCLERAVAALRDDPVRAELTAVLAAAVAWADDVVTVEEHELFGRLVNDLEIGEARAHQILDGLVNDDV